MRLGKRGVILLLLSSLDLPTQRSELSLIKECANKLCEHQRPAGQIHHASFQPQKHPCSRVEMLPPQRDSLNVTAGKQPGLGCEGKDQGQKISAFEFKPRLGYFMRSAPPEVIWRDKVRRNSLFPYFFHCPGNKIPQDHKSKVPLTSNMH